MVDELRIQGNVRAVHLDELVERIVVLVDVVVLHLRLAGGRVGEHTVVVVLHEDVVTGDQVGRSLQRKARVAVAEHDVVFNIRIEGLSTPSKDAGPAVAVHHVVAKPGKRDERADTRAVVVDHVTVVNVGGGVFAKNTFETVPHREVRHFGARSTHDGRTSAATIDDGRKGILALKYNTHDQGDVFVVSSAFDKDGIPSIRITECVRNLIIITRHVDILCHGGSGKKHCPGRN